MFFLIHTSLCQVYLLSLGQATPNFHNSLKSFDFIKISLKRENTKITQVQQLSRNILVFHFYCANA